MFSMDKNQKINSIVLGLIAFIGFPLFTAIFLASENPIKNSITQMGFDLGHYVPFLIWGIFIIAYIIYSTLHILKTSAYKKGVKLTLLIVLCIVDVLFVLTGACSDNPDVASATVINIHNKSAIAMFVGHFVLIGLFTIFSFFRNKTQGFINLTFIGFLLITLVYCYACVTFNDSFSVGQGATALCEAYAFVLIMIFVFLNYVGNIIFKPNVKNPLIQDVDDGKII